MHLANVHHGILEEHKVHGCVELVVTLRWEGGGQAGSYLEGLGEQFLKRLPVYDWHVLGLTDTPGGGVGHLG